MKYALAQSLCGLAALVGCFLLLGLPATLIIGGLAGVALATYAEHISASSPKGETDGPGQADGSKRGSAAAGHSATSA